MFFLMRRPPPRSTLFPYTTLFRSRRRDAPTRRGCRGGSPPRTGPGGSSTRRPRSAPSTSTCGGPLGRERPCPSPSARSEEHTSELQSSHYHVWRHLLSKKKTHDYR